MKNPNYKLHTAEYQDETREAIYKRREARKPVYDHRDPRYVSPEGWCPCCQAYTTAINAKGQCTCGTEVQEKP